MRAQDHATVTRLVPLVPDPQRILEAFGQEFQAMRVAAPAKRPKAGAGPRFSPVCYLVML